MSNFNMHPSFRLNGEHFESQLELISFSEDVSEDLFWFLQEWFSDSETLIVKTSGSTGTPKLIAIQKEYMRNSAKATGAFFELGAETKALCCLSTEYIAGKMMVVRALELGWHLDVVEPISNPLEDSFETYDFCAMVPMQVKASLWDLQLVKKLIIGGGVVSVGLQEQLQQVSTECFATYGMTETVTHIAVKKLNLVSSSAIEDTKYRIGKWTSNYKLLPDITISQDERDCLVINAPLLSDEKVITNDIVKIHSETEFEWLGRFDNVINSGGVKLHPEQIERELSKIISQRFFVAGKSDETLGEKLILVIEGEEISLNFSSLELSKYEVPKEVFFVKQFVLTETQKIQRQKTINLIN
ncbi:AMP-binding protein [Ochrovirga pacifica]|uniref:AMP-binding protein n=1 Tax=Ochrovirga pacifica TaxID=1042376 RepID=UPI000255A027|nr:AMP-binding protein [Ochrovirga pacifica]